MKVEIKPGKYICAVSGGVDSMALLEILSKQPGVDLVVAHFDHGIRNDSSLDCDLVRRAAEKYGYQFESEEGNLGANTSEEQARVARYAFLERIKIKHKAQAIITAHHEDDVIETALINLLRGTGRKGVVSLRSNDEIIRPLLSFSKAEIKLYADKHGIEWREDSTNENTDYLRNYIRKNIVPKITSKQREEFLSHIKNIRDKDYITDTEIANYLQLKDINSMNKQLLIQLDHREACEAMATWLRLNGIREFDRKIIERMVVGAKTLNDRSKVTINKKNYLEIHHTSLEISSV